MVPDRGTKTRLYSSLPGVRGDPNGHQSHCQKSRTQGHSQVNAQQVLVSCSFSCCHRTPPHLSLYSCSLWGKFGEQINKPTTVTVKDPCHLFSLLYDAAFDPPIVHRHLGGRVHDNAVKGTKTNIFVAAFTTCHARLKLYESLDTPGASTLLRQS